MTARPGTQPAPGSPAGPGSFPAIRAALDKPPTSYKSCTHWPNCETASAGLPCYHFDHACTIKHDAELHAAAAAELEAAQELAGALKSYVKMDNDRRAGCYISDHDWAECYQAATAALARLEATP